MGRASARCADDRAFDARGKGQSGGGGEVATDWQRSVKFDRTSVAQGKQKSSQKNGLPPACRCTNRAAQPDTRPRQGGNRTNSATASSDSPIKIHDLRNAERDVEPLRRLSDLRLATTRISGNRRVTDRRSSIDASSNQCASSKIRGIGRRDADPQAMNDHLFYAGCSRRRSCLRQLGFEGSRRGLRHRAGAPELKSCSSSEIAAISSLEHVRVDVGGGLDRLPRGTLRHGNTASSFNRGRESW